LLISEGVCTVWGRSDPSFTITGFVVTVTEIQGNDASDMMKGLIPKSGAKETIAG
jgi:hypothetical protein